jgi:hypothetical protein
MPLPNRALAEQRGTSSSDDDRKPKKKKSLRRNADTHSAESAKETEPPEIDPDKKMVKPQRKQEKSSNTKGMSRKKPDQTSFDYEFPDDRLKRKRKEIEAQSERDLMETIRKVKKLRSLGDQSRQILTGKKTLASSSLSKS